MPAATDQFATFQTNLSDPGEDGFAVTPDDNNDLAIAARTLYVGTGGDVTLITVKGSTLTYKNVPSGGLIRMRTSRVKATGTSAADIVGQI